MTFIMDNDMFHSIYLSYICLFSC